MNPDLMTMKTHEIEDAIAELQAIQKRHRPTSSEWQAASKALQPLFAEMAARTNR